MVVGGAITKAVDAMGAAAEIRRALDEGVAIETRDERGRTALHRAAEGGHLAVARLLLDSGAAVDPVQRALREARLVDFHSDEPSIDSLRTPLHLAVLAGSTEVVGLLLARGSLVDARDLMERTPLHLAAARPRNAAAIRSYHWQLQTNRGTAPVVCRRSARAVRCSSGSLK